MIIPTPAYLPFGRRPIGTDTPRFLTMAAYLRLVEIGTDTPRFLTLAAYLRLVEIGTDTLRF
jgi:hypothetical protein